MKPPHADFADIPIPPQYVRPSGGLYSTHESSVQSFRRQLSLALLGVDKTADNVNQARCILHPPPDTEGYKVLQNMLGTQRRIDYIQADGNCLFRAISKEILGHEKFHQLIRQTLIQYTKENGHLFQKYVFDGTLEAHCKKMECIGYWGSQVEINAAATLLKTNIYVFCKQPNSESYHWICYRPSLQHCTVEQCSEGVKKIVKLSPPKGYHIELIHTFECHFDRVAPSDLLLTSMDSAPVLQAPTDSPSSVILVD